MDKKYQILLEHALYSEFSFALGIPASEMTRFIADHMGEKDQLKYDCGRSRAVRRQTELAQTAGA